MRNSRYTPAFIGVAWIVTLGIFFAMGLFAGIAFFRGLDRQDWTGRDEATLHQAEIGLILERLAGAPVRSITRQADGRLDENFRNALSGLLRVRDNVQRAYKAQRIASELSQRQIVETIAFLQTLPRGPLREEAFLVFLQQWAGMDGRSALAYVLADRGDWDREAAVAAVLRGWAEDDPISAWEWVQERSGSEDVRQQRYQAIFEHVAQYDSELAMALASSIASQRYRSEAMRSIARTELKRIPPEAVLAQLADLPDDRVRMETVAHVLGMWARYDPHEAIDWANSQGDGDLRALARQHIARAWSQFDPKTAASWAHELPEGPVRAAALEEAVSSWIDHEGVVPAAQWLNELELHPDFDAAVQSVALAAMETDPAIAMGWAHSITDPTESEFMVMVVGQYWMERDAQTARNYLEDDPYIPESTRRLLLGQMEPTRVIEYVREPDEPGADHPPED